MQNIETSIGNLEQEMCYRYVTKLEYGCRFFNATEYCLLLETKLIRKLTNFWYIVMWEVLKKPIRFGILLISDVYTEKPPVIGFQNVILQLQMKMTCERFQS